MPIIGPFNVCQIPIFFGARNCLIKSGILLNATFTRSGYVIYDGVTYLENTPIESGGEYGHHGAFTNKVQVVDFYNTDINIDNIDTGETVDIMGYSVTKFLLGSAGGSSGQLGYGSGVYDGYTTADFWIWANISGIVNLWSGLPDAAPVNLVPGLNRISGTSFSGVAAGRTILLDNRTTQTPGLQLAIIAQLTKTPYSIAPIYIPTTGTPASIDTCASAPDPDNHGVNWEAVDNQWLIDLLASTGTLVLKNLKIWPTKTQWQTVGDFNILSGADGSQIIYIEAGTGLLCAKDSAGNVCKSSTEYNALTDTDAALLFSDDGKMRIDLNNLAGIEVPFSGHFNVGVTGKWAFKNEDVFSIADTCGYQGLATMPLISLV